MIKDNDFISVLKNEYNKRFKYPKPNQCIIDSFIPKKLGFRVRTYFSYYDSENPSFDMILTGGEDVYFVSLRIKNGNIVNHYLPHLKIAPKVENSIFNNMPGDTYSEQFKSFYKLIEGYLTNKRYISNHKIYGPHYRKGYHKGNDNRDDHKSHNEHNNLLSEENTPYFFKGIRHLEYGGMTCKTYKTCLYHTNINRKDLDRLRSRGFTIDRTYDPSKQKRIHVLMDNVRGYVHKISNNKYAIRVDEAAKLYSRSCDIYGLVKKSRQDYANKHDAYALSYNEYEHMTNCMDISKDMKSIAHSDGCLNGKNILEFLRNINIINDIELCQKINGRRNKYKLRCYVKKDIVEIHNICNGVLKHVKY